MYAAIHQDYWTLEPRTDEPHMLVSRNPLAIFNENECCAWCDLLKALRKMPSHEHPMHLAPVSEHGVD